MPLISPIQPSFGGGELSPSLYSRVDLAKYSSGLRKCRNFIIHPHGGASNRPGTIFVAKAKHDDHECIVRRFVFSTADTYVLEIGHQYIRFFKNGTHVEITSADAWNSSLNYAVNDYCTYNAATYLCIQANTNKTPSTEPTYWTAQTIYEIFAPWTESDLSRLRLEESADVVYITHPDYPPYTLTRYGDTNWQLDEVVYNDGPFLLDNLEDTTLTPTAVTGDITLNASANVFDALHVGALWKIKHYIEEQSVTAALNSATTTAGIKCFTTWRLITHGTWTGTLAIEISKDGGSTWTKLRTFSSADDNNINTYGTEDVEVNIEPFLVRLNMVSHSSGTCNTTLSCDAFYQNGIVRISDVLSATIAEATVLTELGKITATDEWAEGAWSDYRGYPAVARFFYDRLCFAASDTEPMTTWMTVTGSYNSFYRHSPLLDTDGITVNLPSRQINRITDIVSLRRMILFTSGAEWSVGPVSGEALTPKKTDQKAEGYRGAATVEPVIVGNECIFVQRDAKVIRTLDYQLASDGYVGSNLNILANHLFDNYQISELVYQQNPNSIVWGIRSDGSLVAMTYMREQEVVAWGWHDTEGDFESLCVIPRNNHDELWCVVNRENGRCIEYFQNRMAPDQDGNVLLKNQIFMDSTVTFANGESITGLTHLEGERVQVMVDGIPQDTETVTSGGLPSMTLAEGTVHVGLPYYSDLETLNIEIGLRDGSIQGRRAKIGNVTFRVLNTSGGWVGPNANNIYEAFPNLIAEKLDLTMYYDDPAISMYDDPLYTYDGESTAERMYSGDLRVPLGAGYEDGGRVFYRQVDPLPVTITAIVPEFAPGGATN